VRNRGFTLIEIILALGIFSFAMLTIFGLVSRGLQTSRESRVEGAAAILGGQINSLLKASYAWNSTVSNNSDLSYFLGSRSLGQIAAASPEIRTNFYNQDLKLITNSLDDPEYQVVTEIRPISQNNGFLAPEETALQNAISRLDGIGHCVFVHIEISYPAKAPESQRSKRFTSSILSRTTDE
jgi:prepilin-type N-terminal cleavage/methylation domain-containing protein